MATNQPSGRSSEVQPQQSQGRSVTRYGNYPFPNFGGDLFSLNPFAMLREMTDWMDRSLAPTRSGESRGATMWSPAIEVRQQDNNLLVYADLPGVDQKDVKVEIDNDMLVIQGERKHESTTEREGWHRSERMYGSFYRAIPLPEGAKADDTKADFRNGVLEIKVPLEQPKSNRRQIQIQSGTSQK